MKNVNVSVNSAAKLSKRLLSAVIELFLVITTSYLLMTFVATPIANNVANYSQTKELCNEESMKYYKIAKEEQYNILKDYELKNGSFNLEYSDEFTSADKKEKEEMLNKFNSDERVKELIVVINDLNGKVNTISNLMLISSALIPELVFWLIIPLIDKKKRSLGMMINKLEIIHRDDLEVKNSQIVKRFLSLYLLQTVIFFFVFGVSFVYMVPLICFIMMYMSINRYAIHDLIAKTKIVDADPILFRDLEDRDNYLNFNRRRKKDVIDAVTNEQKRESENHE